MCLNRVVFAPQTPEVPHLPPALPFWADIAQMNNDTNSRNEEPWRRRKDGDRHRCPICQHLSPTQSAMLAALSSLFECSFLVFSALSALMSILQPKVKHAALLVLLPLAVLLPEAIARKASASLEKAELCAAMGPRRADAGVISYRQSS